MFSRITPLFLTGALFAVLTPALADPPAASPGAAAAEAIAKPVAQAAVPAAPAREMKPSVLMHPPVHKSNKCPAGSTVLVEVRGVALLVPRTAAYRVTLDDGKTHMTLGRPIHDYDCSTPVIKNVRGLATVNYRLGIPGGNSASEKSFSAARTAMLTAPKLKGSIEQKLPNGIVKVTAPLVGSELFQLPLESAPTYDKVPVIFDCDASETGDMAKVLPQYCHVAYLHPTGLPLTYSVAHADYPTDDFLAADQAKRKEIDGMIEAAKAKTDLENKDK